MRKGEKIGEQENLTGAIELSNPRDSNVLRIVPDIIMAAGLRDGRSAVHDSNEGLGPRGTVRTFFSRG